MLATNSSARKRTLPPVTPSTSNVNDTNPPIITLISGAAERHERHPIYGITPIGRDGFVLERQSVHMLNSWHKRADAICLELSTPGQLTNEEEARFEVARSAAWDIYKAALKTKLYNPREISILLDLMVRHGSTHGGDNLSFLDLKDLAGIVEKASSLTEPARPTKSTGALRIGTRLTRSGLLFRYHAFLINELLSVGLELYGNHKVALANIPFEDAVQAVCGKRVGRGKTYPFHDQSKLADRARTIFKKIGIDATSDKSPIRDRKTGEVKSRKLRVGGGSL